MLSPQGLISVKNSVDSKKVQHTRDVSKRKEQILEKIKTLSHDNDVDPEVTRAVFDFLINYSVEIQNKIINGLAKIEK